jgi:beta-lactamase superfamily II metal-dependent hydrolase
MAIKQKKGAKKPSVAKSVSKPGKAFSVAPIVAPGSPTTFRARVRMYRQGLGDCFLITFPQNGTSFHVMIDCGVLVGTAETMTRVVEHVRDTVRDGKPKGKARIDVLVATHEHKDHLSGFNQARDVFNKDFEFGSVWLGWTENLTKAEIKKIKDAKKRVALMLRSAVSSPLADAAEAPFAGVDSLLKFTEDDDTTGAGKIAEALEYLKVRGKDAGDLRYLEPGTGPIELHGLEGVRVFVLGPPRDPSLLRASKVTEADKKDDVIYHLARTGEVGVEALAAAVSMVPGSDGDRYYPFATEHRIPRVSRDPVNPAAVTPNPHFAGIQAFVARTYDDPVQEWRRIDHDWLMAFGQLALDLDSDTNNTSLVLAFEFVDTSEVLLLVGDAQVGNWKSWASVAYDIPGRSKPMPAHDLLARTVLYKVGHHASHNATLKKGGLS